MKFLESGKKELLTLGLELSSHDIFTSLGTGNVMEMLTKEVEFAPSTLTFSTSPLGGMLRLETF